MIQPRCGPATTGESKVSQCDFSFLFFCKRKDICVKAMTTLLRLNPLKALRHLRNRTPLECSLDLGSTTRLGIPPAQLPRQTATGGFARTSLSAHAEGLPEFDLTSNKTMLSITRPPRVNVTTRKHFE